MVKSTYISVVCIAKSIDGRPSRVYIEDFDSKDVALKPVEGSYEKPLWVPRQVVFQYNPDLLRRLQGAYATGDVKRLVALWKEAKAWKPISK